MNELRKNLLNSILSNNEFKIFKSILELKLPNVDKREVLFVLKMLFNRLATEDINISLFNSNGEYEGTFNKSKFYYNKPQEYCLKTITDIPKDGLWHYDENLGEEVIYMSGYISYSEIIIDSIEYPNFDCLSKEIEHFMQYNKCEIEYEVENPKDNMNCKIETLIKEMQVFLDEHLQVLERLYLSYKEQVDCFYNRVSLSKNSNVQYLMMDVESSFNEISESIQNNIFYIKEELYNFLDFTIPHDDIQELICKLFCKINCSIESTIKLNQDIIKCLNNGTISCEFKDGYSDGYNDYMKNNQIPMFSSQEPNYYRNGYETGYMNAKIDSFEIQISKSIDLDQYTDGYRDYMKDFHLESNNIEYNNGYNKAKDDDVSYDYAKKDYNDGYESGYEDNKNSIEPEVFVEVYPNFLKDGYDKGYSDY